MSKWLDEAIKYLKVAHETGQKFEYMPIKRSNGTYWKISLREVVAQGLDESIDFED